jgi:hypothetical protein
MKRQRSGYDLVKDEKGAHSGKIKKAPEFPPGPFEVFLF